MATPGARPSRSSHGRPFTQSQGRLNSPPGVEDRSKRYPEIKQRGFYSDVLTAGAQDRIGVGIIWLGVERGVEAHKILTHTEGIMKFNINNS